MSLIAPSLESRETMESEATLVGVPETIQPASANRAHHHDHSISGRHTVGLFEFMKVMLKMTLLWLNLLLLPLCGWNAANSTLILVMRGVPLGKQLEVFLRFSYNMAKMELGATGLSI
ncbi:hypothetical protein BDP55DRAFT_628989 [Colletotrichum godetiae]|uniref:Uncharacterized protein n=1 Tax=Colletotrichum godetiae TaxID=1209918 RepID=A0AAJ0F0Y7_9PEZI|nr:uncharacterized protein BDP55DRAFT_628989 [Colletotrichum godetiae]KAK1688993.1 hypothetical protein BDP55DRAFT_628989 [Colletotrichum godetiae]